MDWNGLLAWELERVGLEWFVQEPQVQLSKARNHYPCLARIVLKYSSIGLIDRSLPRPSSLSDWGACPRTSYCSDKRYRHSGLYPSSPSHGFSSSTCVELGKSLFERFGSEPSLPCQELSTIVLGFENRIESISVVSYLECSTTPQCNQAAFGCSSFRYTSLEQLPFHTTPCLPASLIIGNLAFIWTHLSNCVCVHGQDSALHLLRIRHEVSLQFYSK